MMTTSIEADCDNKTTTKNRSIKKSTGASSSSSVFDDRTEEASAIQYFQFYGFLSQQQNMMQDYVRTATYQRAILANSIDFKNKIVMDVGAGSGILSFFAIQAGAKLVYAIEASSMAKHCETLVASNGLTDRIRVIAGKVEDVRVPELVDVIISEPMGYMLVNERMLETYLHSKKFLKPGGRMFPTRGDLHLALFSDEALYLEQTTKASFWCQQSFHGVNLSDLRPQATTEYFRQPIVDTWHIASLLTQSHKWSINFETADERDLHIIDIPFELIITRSGMLHGIAFWFDVAFIGGSETVWLSTAPTEPLTHWYQVRCLLDPNPIVAHQGQTARGRVLMTANDRQSYDIEIEVTIDGTTLRNTLDLKNPYFRYTGQPVMPPPGMNNESPSDVYWQTSSSLPMTATTSNGLSTATTSAIAQQQQHQQPSSLFASFLPPTVANNNDNNRSMMMNGTVPPNIMDMLANAHAAYRGVGIQSGVMTQPNLQHQQQQQQFVQHSTNRNVTPITNTHQHNVLTKSPEPIYSQLIQNQQQQQISAPIMQHHQMPTVGQFGAPNFSTSQLQSDQQQQSSSSTASSSANYRPWTMH